MVDENCAGNLAQFIAELLLDLTVIVIQQFE